MRKRLNLTYLLAIFILIGVLVIPAISFAQDDATPPAEGDTTEEVAADHGEGAVESVAEGETAAAEAESSASPLAPLGINLGFLLAQIFNFLFVFGLLGVFMWRPLMNMLDNRALTISKGLEDASAAANARLNAEAEAEKILSQARAEAAQVVDGSRGQGDELAKTIEAEARKDAEKIREDARAASVAERNQQLADLRGQVKEISIAIAERLIGENLDKSKQTKMIDNFLTSVPAEAKGLSGDVTVVSAMPLDDAEQSKVKKELGTDNVTFTVDPKILGGLVVRSGDRVVDGSMRNSLSDLAGRLA